MSALLAAAPLSLPQALSRIMEETAEQGVEQNHLVTLATRVTQLLLQHKSVVLTLPAEERRAALGSVIDAAEAIETWRNMLRSELFSADPLQNAVDNIMACAVGVSSKIKPANARRFINALELSKRMPGLQDSRVIMECIAELNSLKTALEASLASSLLGFIFASFVTPCVIL